VSVGGRRRQELRHSARSPSSSLRSEGGPEAPHQAHTIAVVPSWLAADGNLPEVGAKPQADRVTEIRPSADEMVRLTAQDAISARGGYGPITAAELDAPLRARVRFDAKGVITEWRGFDERWHHAAELFRQS
jgi:hypothetical protein